MYINITYIIPQIFTMYSIYFLYKVISRRSITPGGGAVKICSKLGNNSVKSGGFVSPSSSSMQLQRKCQQNNSVFTLNACDIYFH